MNSYNLYISLVFISAFISCNSLEPKYGTNYNDVRREIGLPLLKQDWKIKRIHRDYEIWVDPSFNQNVKGGRYWKKSIDYSSNDLLFECDEYVGISNYSTIDGTFRESLKIYYYYRKSNFNGFHPKGWECVLYNQTSIDRKQFGENISLEKADSILNIWGINRVNY